jgi:hypothetical protein
MREFWTGSGVRLRAVGERPGGLNWLLLPGGPGIGSESLYGPAEAIDVPGVTWLVDLPGDGSNPGGGDPVAVASAPWNFAAAFHELVARTGSPSEPRQVRR